MKKENEEELENKQHNYKRSKDNPSNSMAIVLGSLIIAGSILLGFKMFGGVGPSSAGFVDPDSIYSGEAIKQEELLYGKGDKKIIMVEFSDLECPFCKQLHSQTLGDVYKNYGDKIDIAFKHFPLPFHKKAPHEAIATMCARDIGGQVAYRNMIEKIYDVTQGNDSLDVSKLPEYAKSVGVDTDKFNSCLANASSTAEKQAQIEKDIADGVSAGVNGTPGTLVLVKQNDGSYRILTRIEGARDYKYFAKVLDQALKQK